MAVLYHVYVVWGSTSGLIVVSWRSSCKIFEQAETNEENSWPIFPRSMPFLMQNRCGNFTLLSISSSRVFALHRVALANLVVPRTRRRQSLYCRCTASMKQAETAAIDALVSSWSENISVSFSLQPPGYLRLTLWCAIGFFHRIYPIHRMSSSILILIFDYKTELTGIGN